MQTFCIEIPVNDTEKMIEFQDVMDSVQNATVDYIRQLAKELDVTEACATDIYYLRTRSRHTEELEQKLIQMYRDGNPPSIFEF